MQFSVKIYNTGVSRGSWYLYLLRRIVVSSSPTRYLYNLCVGNAKNIGKQSNQCVVLELTYRTMNSQNTDSKNVDSVRVGVCRCWLGASF